MRIQPATLLTMTLVLSVAAVAAFTLIRRARNQEQTVAAFEEEVLTEETDAVALAGSGV